MTVPTSSRELLDIPLGRIDDPSLPSRTSMDDDAMHELTTSIRSIGLQQPMIVARVGDRYEIIAGHRRLIACKRAGLPTAPCIVYPSKDASSVAIQYAENRYREDLNPADEALLFAELLERDCGGDTDVLAERLGEKRAYVEGRLALLADRPIFDALREGRLLKVGIATQLLRVTDERTRHYYLDAAIRGGATVAVVAGWIEDWKRQQPTSSGAAQPAAPAAAPSAVPQLDYFRCYVCKETTNVHLMQPINVHTHCQMAILDKLIAAYRGDQ